jgi:hypothetical protein
MTATHGRATSILNFASAKELLSLVEAKSLLKDVRPASTNGLMSHGSQRRALAYWVDSGQHDSHAIMAPKRLCFGGVTDCHLCVLRALALRGDTHCYRAVGLNDGQIQQREQIVAMIRKTVPLADCNQLQATQPPVEVLVVKADSLFMSVASDGEVRFCR